MNQLTSLEGRQVDLKSSSGLLQASQCQGIGDAQRALVVALVDVAVGPPGARWATVVLAI